MSNVDQTTMRDLLRNGVIYLTSENFSQTNKGTWLIVFYRDTCGHCMRFKPQLQSFAQNINNDRMFPGKALRIGIVDVTNQKNGPLLTEFKIYGVPSIFVIQNGKRVAYVGGRSAEDLLKFFNDFLYPEDSNKRKVSPTETQYIMQTLPFE